MGRDLSENDFGRYLASVEERDIDLLLMEEFQVSDEFVGWFCSNLNLQEARSTGAWHSVSDTDGETDLLLRVVVGGQRIGLLIENKINAPEQHQQAERYHVRGVRSREAGKFEDYRTVICAPQRYLEGLPPDSIYHHRVSYEAIAEWFDRSEGRRAVWRRHIMSEAIEQGRRGYTMLVSATNTAFHMQYWEHLQANHPRIKMQRPQNKGSKSNWIIMKGLDFPPGVKLHHKVDQKVIELGFEGRHVEEILNLQPKWPDEILVVQKGKTASLMTKVPSMDMAKGVSAQIVALEEVLQAAYRLMPFAAMLSAEGKGS
jgi:PD-(D/E)XK nuclease superfamily